MFLGLCGQVPRTVTRAFHSQNGDDGGFSLTGILADRLARFARIARGIQEIVGYLIGQAEIMGKPFKRPAYTLLDILEDGGRIERPFDAGAFAFASLVPRRTLGVTIGYEF